MGVLLIKVPGWVYKGVTDATSAEGVWRHSEIHEFYIAGLMTCYMADVYVRAREISSAKAAGVEPSEKESEKASEQASEKEGSTTSA